MLSKTLSSIESPIEIEEVDIDVNPTLTQQYNVRGVPTLVMVENDTEIKRKVGVMGAEELKNWLNVE
jgi:thioredoxin-like negative regulator of GroEL